MMSSVIPVGMLGWRAQLVGEASQFIFGADITMTSRRLIVHGHLRLYCCTSNVRVL